MAITRAAGRIAHYVSSNRTKGAGTFSDPVKILVDDAPSVAVHVAVTNVGFDSISVRLHGDSTTDWVRVSHGQEASLVLSSDSPVSLELSRALTGGVRWISSRDTAETVTRAPFLVDLRFPALVHHITTKTPAPGSDTSSPLIAR